ncbi:hypothetical protein NPIL_72111 [Nephila pilipes]|uniref:Uncharacterized protein n=1 Tax=Nephila pilipes TaxID=299642 RepID=A0A8X6THH8_NEPPI|nr:hypothetical protein NPIL_72111 [Nephila pilipes]
MHMRYLLCLYVHNACTLYSVMRSALIFISVTIKLPASPLFEHSKKIELFRVMIGNHLHVLFTRGPLTWRAALRCQSELDGQRQRRTKALRRHKESLSSVRHLIRGFIFDDNLEAISRSFGSEDEKISARIC